MNKEIWREVPDFPDYEVSSFGRVKTRFRILIRPHPRNKNIPQNVSVNEKFRKLLVRKRDGIISEVTVGLVRNKVCYTKSVHRLVLTAFVGPCPHGMEGCHNDGDATNNHLSNLRWDTHLNNVADCINHGTKKDPPRHIGDSHPNRKISVAEERQIRRWGKLEKGDSVFLGRWYGITRIHAWSIARRGGMP